MLQVLFHFLNRQVTSHFQRFVAVFWNSNICTILLQEFMIVTKEKRRNHHITALSSHIIIGELSSNALWCYLCPFMLLFTFFFSIFIHRPIPLSTNRANFSIAEKKSFFFVRFVCLRIKTKNELCRLWLRTRCVCTLYTVHTILYTETLLAMRWVFVFPFFFHILLRYGVINVSTCL